MLKCNAKGAKKGDFQDFHDARTLLTTFYGNENAVIDRPLDSETVAALAAIRGRQAGSTASAEIGHDALLELPEGALVGVL